MKNRFLPFVVTCVTMLFFATVNFAQRPDFGTADDFILFSSTGAVNNTGLSHLTGNVGSNDGAVSGFGNVDGVMHSSDGATAQAKADLLLAYLHLATAPPTLFHAPLLGNGDTLVAGVYSITGNTVLNLRLNLDAKGDPNAVFIFQVAGTLSANTSSQVHLINGTLACNVFWKVEGMVSMATGTSMKGTVVANNAAIGMETGVSLEGRALSIEGAVSVSGITAYTPIGCGSAVLTGPAAPSLESIACYAIFSGNGGVANSGITHVKGDIGTNVGLTTGYNPLNVNGKIHPIADGSTAAAAADLINIFDYVNTLPVDIELLYPAQFGHSLVLTPHTYILKGGTSLTDTLFLNAQGNADAVFVIKINGALSTSTFATVVLMNGAKSANVFWRVNGAVSINNHSKIKGTIICNNGAIDLTTGVEVEGRALTTNGALSTAAVIVNVPAGTCSIMEPVITSNSGGSTATVNVAENKTAVTTVAATDAQGNPLIYSLSDGADTSKFSINSSTGDVTFVTPPDFESPSDADQNNLYSIFVRSTDSATHMFDEQEVTVTVTDISEVISAFVSTLKPCPGTAFSVSASIPGTFQNEVHQFEVQLSSSTGSFTDPVVIGSLETTLTEMNNIITIQASVPYNVVKGIAYRIRVVSSSLGYTSSDNGQDIEILRARAGADRIISKCAGSAIDLTNIYQKNDDTNVWNTPNPESVTQPGIYTLTVTTVNGCHVSANVVVRDLAKPFIGNDTTIRITSGTTDLTTVYNTAGLGTRWNTTNPTAAPAGRYRLIASSEGCKDTAVVKVVMQRSINLQTSQEQVSALFGKTALNGKLNVSVYPNPARTGSKLQVSATEKGYFVTLSDLTGKTIWKTGNIHSALLSLPVERLAAGVYNITVNNGTDIKTVKLIKE